MIAMLTNEWFLGGVIIVLLLGIIIHKIYGLGKFLRLFTGSGNRLKAARREANEAEAAEAAKHHTPTYVPPGT